MDHLVSALEKVEQLVSKYQHVSPSDSSKSPILSYNILDHLANIFHGFRLLTTANAGWWFRQIWKTSQVESRCWHALRDLLDILLASKSGLPVDSDQRILSVTLGTIGALYSFAHSAQTLAEIRDRLVCFVDSQRNAAFLLPMLSWCTIYAVQRPTVDTEDSALVVCILNSVFQRKEKWTLNELAMLIWLGQKLYLDRGSPAQQHKMYDRVCAYLHGVLRSADSTKDQHVLPGSILAGLVKGAAEVGDDSTPVVHGASLWNSKVEKKIVPLSSEMLREAATSSSGLSPSLGRVAHGLIAIVFYASVPMVSNDSDREDSEAMSSRELYFHSETTSLWREEVCTVIKFMFDGPSLDEKQSAGTGKQSLLSFAADIGRAISFSILRIGSENQCTPILNLQLEFAKTLGTEARHQLSNLESATTTGTATGTVPSGSIASAPTVFSASLITLLTAQLESCLHEHCMPLIICLRQFDTCSYLPMDASKIRPLAEAMSRRIKDHYPQSEEAMEWFLNQFASCTSECVHVVQNSAPEAKTASTSKMEVARACYYYRLSMKLWEHVDRQVFAKISDRIHRDMLANIQQTKFLSLTITSLSSAIMLIRAEKLASLNRSFFEALDQLLLDSLVDRVPPIILASYYDSLFLGLAGMGGMDSGGPELAVKNEILDHILGNLKTKVLSRWQKASGSSSSEEPLARILALLLMRSVLKCDISSLDACFSHVEDVLSTFTNDTTSLLALLSMLRTAVLGTDLVRRVRVINWYFDLLQRFDQARQKL